MICTAGCSMFGKTEKNFVSRADSRTVITVLAGQSTSDAGIEDMIGEMAAEKFPDITLEWECVDWGDKFSSQLQGKIAAGDIPDIIVGKAQDVLPYARMGVLEPISVPGTETIDADALKCVSYDGSIYGIPYNAWYQGVVYNKDIFDQYNLTVPETRKELDMIVKTLEDAGVTPFASHFQEDWNIGNMTMQFMIGDVFAKEPDWGERFRDGKADFVKNSQMQQCFEQNRYLLEHTFEDASMIDQYESDKRFAEGKAAMYLTGSWSLQAAGQYGGDSDSYGIFPYPNGSGDARLIKETNMTFMIGKGCPHKELVEEILEELLQNEKLMQEILDFTQTYPVVEGVQISYRRSIQEDVERYEQEGRMVDATVGNGQLLWSYQNQLAAQTHKWLNGEQNLQQVFQYADANRNSS